MDLIDTYKAVAPSVVAFISKFGKVQPGETPIAPAIFGTGFLVHEDGIAVTNRHVADIFQKVPTHPKTGAAGYAALMFEYGQQDNLGSCIRWMVAEIFGYTTLGQFSAEGQPWRGQDVPDIAFVQLRMRGTPFLKLSTEQFYIQPGTSIATAGFPMGSIPLTVFRKLNQMIPFVRRGIVSSVFPFAIPYPHGFTIDIMQQGGSSGSPIFYEGEPTVVGMMASSVEEVVTVGGGALGFQIQVPTNISVAVPAHLIEAGLQSFRSTYPVDRSGFPTLKAWQDDNAPAPDLGWEAI